LLNDYTLLGGSFSEGGNLISWAYNNLKLPKIENLNSELLKLQSGSHGISVLPFLLGERALGWSNNSKGIISGLKYSNTSIEILQSFLESISYRLYLVYEMLKDFLDKDVQVIASGGAIKNLPWWIQTTSDVLDKEIYISKDNQDTGKGVAIMMLRALGYVGNFEDIDSDIEEKYSPDKKNHKILLIIAPRHIQRAKKISKINNLNIKIKSKDGLPNSYDNFWISNTYGEMSNLYSLSDIVFVGGSLYPYGGHNPSEPCHYKTKIIMGPHSEKCQDIVREMKDSNALIQLNSNSEDEIINSIEKIIINENFSKSLSIAGSKLAKSWLKIKTNIAYKILKKFPLLVS